MTQYSLDAPRAQINGIGDWPLVRLELVRQPGKGATIGPAAFDAFARQIVDALNAADLIDRAADYVERFADLNGEPDGGDCREVLAALRAFASPLRPSLAPADPADALACALTLAPALGALALQVDQIDALPLGKGYNGAQVQAAQRAARAIVDSSRRLTAERIIAEDDANPRHRFELVAWLKGATRQRVLGVWPCDVASPALCKQAAESALVKARERQDVGHAAVVERNPPVTPR